MRLLVFLFIAQCSFAQWQSISTGSVIAQLRANAANEFEIDEYRNNIWVINGLRASVIEDDGTILNFSEDELGTLWFSSQLNFAFTPDHIYYTRELIGLSNFDNYMASSVFTEQTIERAFNDGDTVFFYRTGGDIYKHIEGVTTPVWVFSGDQFISKNGYKYSHSGGTVYYRITVTNSVSFSSDPDYLSGVGTNMITFDRSSDTLYMAQEAGISLAYVDDVFDTITPNNTVNMPSSNVLDIEFDMNDSLWAVFGDSSGEAFAIAQLEGDTWINRYDNTNCPLNFEHYKGMEFDTLNNLWLADLYHLHTLESSTSPSWLNTIELHNNTFSIYPNPTDGEINISTEIPVSEVQITDMQSRVIWQGTYSPVINTRLPPGIYMVELFDENKKIGHRRIVVK